MINKSRSGSSQEQHHSGSTDNNIPATATSTEEAPEHTEMWSIFSMYPETLSQCIGRKIKMLRLEASAIAIHDNVEQEVKTAIAEEERAQEDVLVIDNIEEETIRAEVETETSKEKQLPKNAAPKKRNKARRLKSTVSVPDIRYWLKSEAERKSNLKAMTSEIVKIPEVDMPAPDHREKKAALRPDLRDWLTSNSEMKEGCKSNIPAVVNEKEEVNFPIIIEESPPRASIQVSSANVASRSDLRNWLSKSTLRNEHGKEIIPEIIEIPDEHSPGKTKRNVIKSRKKDMRNLNAKEIDYTELLNGLMRGEPDDILSNNYLEMRRRDYRSLEGKNYLNDKIIDEYLQLIRQRNVREGRQKVYSLTTHAYTWLEQDYNHNFSQVARWFTENIEDIDLILAPIHRADHWSLVAVDLGKEVLSYYDSIYGSRKRSNGPKMIKKFLEQYCQSKGKSVKLKVKIIDNAPLQGNGYDCGVFVCQNAEKIARGAFVDTKQEEMPSARKKMMKEIYFGTLDVEVQAVRREARVDYNVKKVVKKKQVVKKKADPLQQGKSVIRNETGKPRIKWQRQIVRTGQR